MRILVVITLGLMVVIAGCAGVPFAEPRSESTAPKNATVVEVVDGDTIDVRFSDGSQDRVRLLGVDTPEVHVETEPGEFEGIPDTEAGKLCLRSAGQNATEALEGRIGHEPIRLEFDPLSDRRGGYDRLLAYVIHDGTNLNYWLVENGYARVYDTEFTQADRFYAAEGEAQQAEIGVWNCTSLSA